MDKILQKIEVYLLYAVVFLLPIIVLPISPNPFAPAKLTVLAFGVGLVLLVKSVRVISSGKLDFSVGKFDFPVLLLAVAYVLSAILRTPNKMEAWLLPGGATAIVGGALLYFSINQLDDKQKKAVGVLLFLSGSIFAVIMLAASLNILAKIPQLPAYARLTSFNPAGGFLPATIFLATLIPLGVSLFISERKFSKKIFLGVSSVIILLGVVSGIINMLPGKPFSPRLPSASVSWSIAIDSLKESPIIGIGPGNYLTAFNRFRPLAYNTTDLWAIRFGTANDFYLTLFTETGLLGAAGLILLVLSVYRVAQGRFRQNPAAPVLREATQAGKGLEQILAKNASFFSLGVLLALLTFFPATVLLIAILFIFFSLNAAPKKTSLNLSTQVVGAGEGPAGQASQKLASRLPALLVTLPVIVAVLLFGYRASRAIAAELKYKQALDALARNEATTTYDTLRASINLNPTVDRYHASYAQVNLALANAIAGVEEIADVDRANIAQLIQQAIREAKATVALNPLRAGNWELLARIYRAIAPFAEGADAFAIQSYRQAVALDPVNPNLRIDLGGVHYAQGAYDTAIRIFELAVVAKPDHPNSHYNLAFALRESGDIDQAIQQMTIVLSLVDRGTSDYEAARTALEDLEARRATSLEAAAGEELTPPQPAEEPILRPPLELPEEAEPPEAPISPTPVPDEEEGVEEGESPTITPEPTPTPAP